MPGIKLRQVIMEHFLLSEDASILGIQAEDQPHAEHVQAFQRLLVFRIPVLLQESVIKEAHDLTGGDGDFHFPFQVLIAHMCQEGKPVIFLRKIFQQNHLGRASRLLHVVYMELLEIACHDPAGPLGIGQLRRVAFRLLEGREQRPVRLFDRLHQILFGTLLLNHHMGGRDHAVDEAGVVQVHLVFKGNKLLRFFHAADIAKKGEPEFLAFPLLVAFILPILREFLRGLPGQRVIHFHHLLRGEACRRSPGSSAFPWA